MALMKMVLIQKLVDDYKSEILVKKDSGINSLKDLKGKKIALQDVTSTKDTHSLSQHLKKKRELMQRKI